MSYRLNCMTRTSVFFVCSYGEDGALDLEIITWFRK